MHLARPAPCGDVLSVNDLIDHASISTTSRQLHGLKQRLRTDLQRVRTCPPDLLGSG